MVHRTKADAEHTKRDESFAADWRGTRRYEVVRCIGRGGMGIVYEARDRDMHRRVALKTLHDFAPAALLRFKQEFRTLADVQHPNLVRLHEFVGDEGERVFFSMELIRGTDFLTYVQPGARQAGASSDVASLPSTGEAPSGVQLRSTPPPGQAVIVAPPADASSRCAALRQSSGVRPWIVSQPVSRCTRMIRHETSRALGSLMLSRLHLARLSREQ
jgi:hypothetical protein